jgi:hypothetical protein
MDYPVDSGHKNRSIVSFVLTERQDQLDTVIESASHHLKCLKLVPARREVFSDPQSLVKKEGASKNSRKIGDEAISYYCIVATCHPC